MQRRRRPLLFLALVALAWPAFNSLANSYIYVPLETRVEQADLIVIGRVIADTANQYTTPGNNCGRGEAVLTVIEVLRGTLESSRAERLPNGTNVQTIRMRHYEALSPESGNFHQIVMDPAYKDRIDGIWFLQRSDVPGIYCATSQNAERLDQLVSVRKCLRGVFSEPSSGE